MFNAVEPAVPSVDFSKVSTRHCSDAAVDRRDFVDASSDRAIRWVHAVPDLQKALGRPDPKSVCSDERDYDVTAVSGGHRDIVPFDKLTGRVESASAAAVCAPEPGSYEPSFDAVLPRAPSASLALRGREESAASGKRWEGNVLELNPDFDAVKPSTPSAVIGAFVLSAKAASGAACCDDVPGVGT